LSVTKESHTQLLAAIKIMCKGRCVWCGPLGRPNLRYRQNHMQLVNRFSFVMIHFCVKQATDISGWLAMYTRSLQRPFE